MSDDAEVIKLSIIIPVGFWGVV